MKMRNSKRWLAGLMGLIMCLTLTVTVKQNVRAEEENAEAQNAEEQNAEAQNTEEQNAEAQNAEAQNTEEQNAGAVSISYVVTTEDTWMYAAADGSGGIIASLPKNTCMIKSGEEGVYTKVNYYGISGYIDSRFAGYNEEAVAARLEEVRMMAAMIQCEAGNQPAEGQLAVGAVIINRVKAANYPNSITEVLFQPRQFGPSDSRLFAELLANNTIKDTCRITAMQAFMGADNVYGALHFRRAGKKEGIVIGNHVFY